MRVLDENKLTLVSPMRESEFSLSCVVYSQQYNAEFLLQVHPMNAFTWRALAIVNSIDHPNIIRIYKCFVRNDRIYVLKEFCEENLIYALQQNVNTYEIFSDIVNAVAHCHHKCIAHNNIQPSSIVLDRYQRGKLSNFLNPNIDCKKGKLSHNFNNKNDYTAPEVLKNQEYDPYKADIWSLGVLLYFMTTRIYPWKQGQERVMTKEMLNRIGNPYVYDVVERCTQSDPSKRITIDELINLSWRQNSSSPNRKKTTLIISKRNTLSRVRLTKISNYKSASVVVPKLHHFCV